MMWQEMEKDNMRDHMRPIHNQADAKYTNPNSGKYETPQFSLITLAALKWGKGATTTDYRNSQFM